MPENIIQITLPIPKEEIVKYFGHFNEYTFSVDYKKSLENLKSNHNILTYISNCEMINTLLDNYETDENFEDLFVKYIKFDRPVSIPILDDLWCSVLHNKDYYIQDEDLKEFVIRAREKYTDIVKECNSFFYSLRKALENIIVPTDKELEESLKKAENNKLTNCGINIVSLENAIDFYQYIGSIENDKIYMYDEFVHNVLNGMSVTSYFILNDPFFRNLFIYNKYNSNPQEEGTKIQNILDQLNNMRSE